MLEKGTREIPTSPKDEILGRFPFDLGTESLEMYQETFNSFGNTAIIRSIIYLFQNTTGEPSTLNSITFCFNLLRTSNNTFNVNSYSPLPLSLQ